MANLKIYVTWATPELASDMQSRIQADDGEGLARLQQKVDGADLIWKSWAMANDGTVLSVGNGQGSMQISPEKLSDLPRYHRQYSQALGANVAMGVGMKLSEAQTAMEAARRRGGYAIVLFTPEVQEELEQADKKKDPIKDILGQEHLDEGAVQKAEPLAQNSGAGGGFGGFARGSGAAPPAPPMQEASEHSDAEGVMSQINDPERPPAPEMTHAASDLDASFHALASQQDVKDAQGAQEQQVDVDAVKGAVVTVLQQVRAKAPAFGKLKQEDPDAYNAVNALVQSVIAMAHSLEGATTQPQLQKAEKLLVDAGEVLEAYFAKALDIMDGVSPEEAQALAQKLGVDTKAIDLEQFRQGIAHEREHSEVVDYDPVKTAQIAHDHLKEDPAYYQKLASIEDGGLRKAMSPVVDRVFWHGSPSGDLRGAAYGLHVGSRKAAEEALHARIGMPAEGGWDGTREYGKTLLAGARRRREMGHAYPSGPEDDYYPSGKATFSDGTKIPLDAKPTIFPVKIVGPMVNSYDTPVGDFYANGRMRSHVTRGNAKRGYYYTNVSEDEGSVSAVVPNGGTHLQRLEPHDLEKAGNKLPMPKAPTHKDLHLPAGSVKEGGPTGNAHGDVGKRKIQHGDGHTSWVQARAGQVTAVADRHAAPVIGHAGHPISSRNPTGH